MATNLPAVAAQTGHTIRVFLANGNQPALQRMDAAKIPDADLGTDFFNFFRIMRRAEITAWAVRRFAPPPKRREPQLLRLPDERIAGWVSSLDPGDLEGRIAWYVRDRLEPFLADRGAAELPEAAQREDRSIE